MNRILVMLKSETIHKASNYQQSYGFDERFADGTQLLLLLCIFLLIDNTSTTNNQQYKTLNIYFNFFNSIIVQNELIKSKCSFYFQQLLLYKQQFKRIQTK